MLLIFKAPGLNEFLNEHHEYRALLELMIELRLWGADAKAIEEFVSNEEFEFEQEDVQELYERHWFSLMAQWMPAIMHMVPADHQEIREVDIDLVLENWGDDGFAIQAIDLESFILRYHPER